MKYLKSSQYPSISETDSKIWIVAECWIIQLTSSLLISFCSDPNGLSALYRNPVGPPTADLGRRNQNP